MRGVGYLEARARARCGGPRRLDEERQTPDCSLVKRLLSGSLHFQMEITVAGVTVLVLAAALPFYLRFRRRRRAA